MHSAQEPQQPLLRGQGVDFHPGFEDPVICPMMKAKLDENFVFEVKR